MALTYVQSLNWIMKLATIVKNIVVCVVAMFHINNVFIFNWCYCQQIHTWAVICAKWSFEDYLSNFCLKIDKWKQKHEYNLSQSIFEMTTYMCSLTI